MNEIAAHVNTMLKKAAQKWQDDLPLQRVMTEWEVVFLLGVLAHDAGITLKSGSDAYPDAILQVEDDSGVHTIRTELEYAATNFNHDPAGCDLVICWIKDAPSIFGLPVIGLQEYFPSVASVGTTTLNLDDKPESIRNLFYHLDGWLQGYGLDGRDTARNQAFTNTLKYHVHVNGTMPSLCAVQYMPSDAPRYVELRFQGKALDSLALSAVMSSCWSAVMRLNRPGALEAKFTDGSREYKIRCYPDRGDLPVYLPAMLNALTPLMQAIANSVK